MGCFVSVEQFSNFEFLLQQMYHIQDHLVQKSIFDGIYFSKVTSKPTLYRVQLYYILTLPHRLFGASSGN